MKHELPLTVEVTTRDAYELLVKALGMGFMLEDGFKGFTQCEHGSGEIRLYARDVEGIKYLVDERGFIYELLVMLGKYIPIE